MATPEQSPDERVLVLMPTAQDAGRTLALLAEARLGGTACADVEAVCRELAAGAGVVLLTDEAVTGDGAARLSAALGAQPAWSYVPLVVLTREGTEGRHAAFRESANATLVERPVRMRTLLSVVRAALRARRHQYEVRDLLAERAAAEAAVRASEERHRALVTACSDAVYRMSGDWEEMLPLDGRGLVASNAHPIRGWMQKNLPASEHARVRAAIARAVATAGTFELEHQVIRPDGTPGWTFSRAVPIADAAGRVVEWFGMARDVTDRKAAEQAIRERDERLQLLLGTATDYAVIISDPDDRVLEWLGGAEAITGWRADEVQGRTTDVIFTPEDRAAGVPARETAKAAQAGRAENVRWHQRKDGSRFFAEGVTVALRGPAGEVRGFGKVFRDATARKLAEEQLTRDALLLANVHDAVIMTDLDGVVTYWNEGANRLFGWTAEEMVGRPYADRFAEPVRSWVAGEIRKRAAGSDWTGEYEDYRKDGSRVWIDARVTSIRDASGAVVGVLGVSHDISERKRAEEALRASEERLRGALAIGTVGVVFWDEGLRLADVNEAFLGMTGFDRAEVLGKAWQELTPREFHARSAAAIAELAARGECAPYEKQYLRKDGSRWWGLFAARRVGAEIVEFVLDVTDRQAAEDALRDADRKKDDFIALLAHELRNPLAPIRNGLQVLRLSPDRDARERAQAMMDRQLTHMVRLIDDLLDVSRISRNKMELRLARILLTDAVGSAVETARPVIEAAGHELALDLPPDPVFLDADLTRLAQVFANLLTNSAKYTERGGRITLAARRDGGEVVVSVTDSGIGIPAESLPRIFDMFSQVDRSIERSTGGLGIGLALVKGLVEMHGGTVTAESGGQGKGSEFTVRLPAVPVRPDRPADTPAGQNGADSGPGRRILVVDDNRDSAESMGEMLRLFGHQVALAHDGVEAVERAGALRPEVILMDVGMPRLNGYEAARRIREQPWGRVMSIIALTGWGQDTDRARTREAGCDGHLVKPVSLDDLTRLLSGLNGAAGGK